MEGLEIELRNFQEQLMQVQQTRKNAPDDEELIELENELKNAVELTKELLSAKTDSALSVTNESAPVTRKYEIGDYISSSFSENLRENCLITGYAYSEEDPIFKVVFLGRGKEEVEIKLSDVSEFCFGNLEGLRNGDRCKCLIDKDNTWVDAVVQKVNYGVITQNMTFELKVRKMKGIVVEVDAYHVRPLTEEEAMKLPQFLPTDSTLVIKRKKKQVKAIRYMKKKATIDKERDRMRTNWKSFLQNTAKSKVKGHLIGLRTESIFKAPEGVHGRVGVIGSEKPMTQQSSQQKRVQPQVKHTLEKI